MATLKQQLVTKLEKIPGLEDRPSRVAGGSAIFYNGKEIAHFHSNNEIDLRLTKQLIRQEGLVHPEDSDVHPGRSNSSQWIELQFRSQKQVDEIVRLFKLALTQY